MNVYHSGKERKERRGNAGNNQVSSSTNSGASSLLSTGISDRSGGPQSPSARSREPVNPKRLWRNKRPERPPLIDYEAPPGYTLLPASPAASCCCRGPISCPGRRLPARRSANARPLHPEREKSRAWRRGHPLEGQHEGSAAALAGQGECTEPLKRTPGNTGANRQPASFSSSFPC